MPYKKIIVKKCWEIVGGGEYCVFLSQKKIVCFPLIATEVFSLIFPVLSLFFFSFLSFSLFQYLRERERERESSPFDYF